MIRVISINRKDVYTFEAVGHASADESKDWEKICAAASILDRTAAEMFSGIRELNAKIKCEEDGKFGLAARPPEKMRSTCENLLAVFLTGYILLAEEYPESVKVLTEWEDEEDNNGE